MCKCAGIKHWKCLETLGGVTETYTEAIVEKVGEEGSVCIWFLTSRTVVGLVLQGLSHAGNVIYSVLINCISL